MVKVKIVACDLKILCCWYLVRVKIVDCDLKILGRGYIWLGLRS